MQVRENALVGAYILKTKRYKAWQRVVSFLICIVVFCTTYALMLPAITQERQSFCGHEEHIHEDRCYVRQPAVETISCTAEFPENSVVLHTHNSFCYDRNGAQICTMAELLAHIHTESCYSESRIHSHDLSCQQISRGMLLCTEEESPGHTHGTDCYILGENLICGMEATAGYAHSDACYTEKENLTCTRLETPGHSHSDGCYTVTNRLVCQEEESETHTHRENCYSAESLLTCGQEEVPAHEHTETCRTQERVLQCIREEIPPHEHSDDCYEQILNCGQEISAGHSHDDSCYEQIQDLICGLEEGQTVPGELICGQVERKLHIHGTDCGDESNCREQQILQHDHTADCVELPVSPETLTCGEEETENHTHTERCYGIWTLGCGMEAHSHDLTCYSDPTADVETQADWEASFHHITLTGNYREDILAIAQTQLGYTESTANYVLGEDGTIKGYTRYGAWYGSPYGDWCAMFVSFCLRYAQVEEIGIHWGVRPWIEELEKKGLYAPASEYQPVPGDLVFFDWEQDELADHVGLVAEILDDGTVKTIEGNSENRVCYVTYGPESPDLLGYGILPEKPETQEEEITEFICGMEEHIHSEECRNELDELQCGLTEHSHCDDCILSEPTPEETTQYAVIYTDGSFETLAEDTVRIAVTGNLPAEAYIRAYPVVVETELQVLCAYEIEILLPDGTVFEPVEGETLNVVFQSSALEDRQDMQVYYIPEEGEPEAIDSTVTEDGLEFEAPHFSVYAVMTAAGDLEAYNDGNISFSYNTVRDAFIYDPAYARFYNTGSPLGTAGSFHIVGFGTVTLNSHTNGNVLAHTLIAMNNFGTNSKNNVNLTEISYTQNYQKVNANSSADVEDYLVIGSENTVAKTNNGYSLSINGVKMDKPNNIIQDADTGEAPFIDLARVETEINAISSNLNNYETSSSTILRAVTTGSDPYLELMSPDDVGIYNMTSAQLQAINGTDGWDMRGFVSGGNGAIVINVDCANADRSTVLNLPKSRVYVDGEKVPLEETLDFSAGKVIWNFVNASGLEIATTEMTGMVIAPGATVNIMSNLNGTVVAENVNVNAESHRTDFNGRIVPTDHIDGAHIHVYKVDKNNYGKFLPGAVFALYEWNGASWVEAQQNSKDLIKITDAEGKVVFQDLTYNVAYKLEETQAPPGYRISTDAQYYYFPHKDTKTYPVRKPSDFAPTDGEECIIHYYPNEESDVDVTALHLEKRWQDDAAKDLTVIPWESVEVEITRGVSKAVLNSQGELTYNANGEVIYEQAVTVSVYDTVTVYGAEGWTKTISNLPKTSDDRKEKYTYSAREVGTLHVLIPDENGIVIIVNKADVTYVPLSVRKYWDGEPASQATLQLYRVFRTEDMEAWSEPELVLDNIVLDAAGNWSWSTGDSPLVKEMTYAGVTATYAYFLTEVPMLDGYYPDYHEITAENPLIPNGDSSVLEITNREIQYTDLNITKSWLDKNGSPLTETPVDSITVQIEMSVNDGETWTPHGEPVEITAEDNWEYTSQALPLQSDTGQPICYRVTEVPVDGFLSTGGEVGEDGSVQLINRRIETTSLQIRKVWKDVGGKDLVLPPVESVQVQLLRSVNGGPWIPYGEPMTVLAEDNWQLTVTGLPALDSLLNETYTYTVEEIAVSDLYVSTVSQPVNGQITVTNTRTVEATDVLVRKRWLNRHGTEFYANAGSVEVQLFQVHQPVGSQGSSSSDMVNVTVKLTQYGDDGSLFSGSTYTVPSGSRITVKMYTYGDTAPRLYTAPPNAQWSRTEVSAAATEREGSRLTCTYVYTATSDIVLIGQTNHWNINECGGESSYTAAAADGKAYGTVRLNVANGWKYLFPDLPLYSYDDRGNITGSYFYYVVETDGSQYSVTYRDASGNAVSPSKPITGGTVTVTNKLSEDTYVLPETGGSGTEMYTGTGLLLICFSIGFLIYFPRRRKGNI